MPFFSKTHSAVKQFDVFNGDADGICALHQLRLAEPAPDATLVTGVKRDIQLLNYIKDVRKSRITVLDVSMHSNMDSLQTILAAENEVIYIDHHFAGEIPTAKNLTRYIYPTPDWCTSLIVDKLLGGRFKLWSICGAYGDNLHHVAGKAAEEIGLDDSQTGKLREIGELLNYNGYGANLQDLYFPPDQLFKAVHDYQNPFDFYEQSQTLKTLKRGFKNDMDMALSQPLYKSVGKNRVYRLPDSPWSRRVSGVFANLKARENPEGAHALITENSDGTLRISVRAPLADKRDADTLCRSFPNGGGRAAAAGINALPEDMFNLFLESFKKTYH